MFRWQLITFFKHQLTIPAAFRSPSYSILPCSKDLKIAKYLASNWSKKLIIPFNERINNPKEDRGTPNIFVNNFEYLLEVKQGGEALDAVLLGNGLLSRTVDLSQGNTLSLQLSSGLLVFRGQVLAVTTPRGLQSRLDGWIHKRKDFILILAWCIVYYLRRIQSKY